MTENNDTISLEQQVLKESIVSAAGLNSDKLQIGLKGDPSMRESVSLRKRYLSSIDNAIDDIVVNLEDMMLNRGVYRIFVGFNSGEIRTLSVFDPLRSEFTMAQNWPTGPTCIDSSRHCHSKTRSV